MCIGATKSTSSQTFHISSQNPRRSKRNKIQIHGLNRIVRLHNRKKGTDEKMGKELEVKNLKLYMENISIFEENEKLRKKASLLHQENLYLMSEFQKRLIPKPDRISTILSQIIGDQ